jgi:hypothetical protein
MSEIAIFQQLTREMIPELFPAPLRPRGNVMSLSSVLFQRKVLLDQRWGTLRVVFKFIGEKQKPMDLVTDAGFLFP